MLCHYMELLESLLKEREYAIFSSFYCPTAWKAEIGGQVGILDSEDKGHIQVWWSGELESAWDLMISCSCQIAANFPPPDSFMWESKALSLRGYFPGCPDS